MNFGSSTYLNYVAPIVLIGESVCVLSSHTDSEIVCRTPGGSGANRPLTVSVGSQKSANTLLYSYNPPQIYTLSPANGPSSGAMTVELRGVNFASQDATITAGISLYAPTFQNDSLILFTIGPGSGTINIGVVVFQQASNYLEFVYDPPILTDLSPRTAPTVGPPNTLVLTGTGFGLSGSVRFGTLDLSAAQTLSYTPTSITVYLPAGQGVNISVSVLTLGQTSNAITFDYLPPTITLMSPNHAPAIGGELITFTGSQSN